MSNFGIYLHWPFCSAKCPYCDFNSHVVANIDQNLWVRAYLSELERAGSEASDRVLNSVYFGGGTPSLMHPKTVETIIDAIKRTWRLANDVEITLEANPTSIEISRFRDYRAAGVNRVSIGVQALNDPDLSKLGRMHSADEARKAVELANHVFDRISFDLIYARQEQTIEGWRQELTEALGMGSNHLSLYQLTVEDGTAFADRLKLGGLKGLPEEDTSADMYELTQNLCSDAGLHAYEVSNHAKPGEESHHNNVYWTAGDFVGIGPGAHGRLTLDGKRFATDTLLSPQQWLNQVMKTGNGEWNRQQLSASDQANEYIMMGLRLDTGVSIGKLNHLDPSVMESSKIKDLESIGMLSTSKTHVWATQKGRPVLNAIIRDLLVDS